MADSSTSNRRDSRTLQLRPGQLGIPMKLTWHGHSSFRIEAGEAKIVIDPFLSDYLSRDNRRSGYLTGKNSKQRGDL